MEQSCNERKDWYDGYIEEADDMNFYISSDWHLNHQNIKTYCQRPDDFTELILKRHNHTVTDNDTVFVLGDVAIGKRTLAVEAIRQMKGRLILVRGNHDRDKSCSWWMDNGFDFACDSFTFRHVLFTHEPYGSWQTEPSELSLPQGCEYNVHGHLHNLWDGFHYNGTNDHSGATAIVDVTTGKPFETPTKLWYQWQRLFAIEYTDYRPIEFEKFLANPERFQSTGPKKKDAVPDATGEPYSE